MKKQAYAFILCSLLSAFFFSSVARAEEKIQWEGWSDSLFQRAKKEKKLIVLDLEAVWCHWCHVMEEETYSNPKIIALIRAHYIAVKVDQDSRPDLTNRYEDYGWPATVFFNSDGKEIVARSGFIPHERMSSILEAIIKDPTPVPTFAHEKVIAYSKTGALSESLRTKFKKTIEKNFDTQLGSWNADHKYLDAGLMEYLLVQAKSGDAKAKQEAQLTLKNAQKIIDPAWGGMYQYSVNSNWVEPHFEKIISVQTDAIGAYARAFEIWKNPSDLSAAKSIEQYLENFLMSSDGAFYTSQDADLVQGQHSDKYFALKDSERRKMGLPRVDAHQYARENAWAVEALLKFYAATGESTDLDKAKKTADWILKNRSLPGGGFSHDKKDLAGPYLGDTLFSARAFLALYAHTGNQKWLKLAEGATNFIDRHFRNTEGSTVNGFMTSAPVTGAPFLPRPQGEENIQLARLCNLLFHYTGHANEKTMAEESMRFLGTEQMTERYFHAPGILLADAELSSDPIHIVIVGHKDDPAALELFKAGLNLPSSYKRTEWFDSREGALPNTDVSFPPMGKAAAFACAFHRCSLPAFEPQQIAERVDRLASSR